MERWRIDELAERAAAVLDGTAAAAASGRVTPVPDRRMLRYYTTLGLLDRPELHGRVAYYGRRHLLQVVAIKRLQAGGATLAQVQEALAGATTSTLERIADLPAEPPAAPGGRPSVAAAPARQFWRAAPAPAPAGDPPPPDAGVLSAVRLAPGVTLVLDDAGALDPHDAGEIRAAAAGLLAHLHAAGLIDEPAPPTTRRDGP
jgi:DNA-binding transcriptional MerR regulator